ncbi:MAG: LptF/LptG family permease [Campylobacter sp.]|nr:LptF/LptG family permease [Campylobacter sp.]
MDRVNRYFLSSFVGNFSSLFATLFLIMSIVFFMQIARLTAVVEITFFELIKLYLFMLPRVLIFTVPISFFVAVATSFFRLSKENETTVFFTLGYSPKNIQKFFMKLAFFLSAFMLFVSLIVMPIAENLKDNFTSYKKTKAVLNIKTAEFGQKFDNWLVYIESEEKSGNDSVYSGIVMYYPKTGDENERIIFADHGVLDNQANSVVFRLENGNIYTKLDSSWHITHFKNMSINSNPTGDFKEPTSVWDYWAEMQTRDKRKKDFSIYTLVSLFPLACTLFSLSFGIVVYRYEQGGLYAGISGVLFAYFALLMIFAKYPFVAIPAIFFGFLIASIVFWTLKIAKRF